MRARLELVRERLGFRSWRPGQLEVMARLIRGSDVVAVLPTGSGKSLTYQIPALLRPGLTLVVSPLVALMRDQLRALRERGILGAAAIHTGQSQSEQEEILAGARGGRYGLLYVSPERLWSKRFRTALRRLPVARVAVDEAHCVSQWGHTFRPEYAAIADAVRDLVRTTGGGRPAIVALTATATPQVQKEIAELLDIGAIDPIVRSPDRPELRYYVQDCANRDERDTTVVRVAESFREQPVIVYVPRRADTQRLAGMLRAANHRARPYHGDMPSPERLHVEESFLDGDVSVVVATKAFGLGIDKPDIAAVVHLEMPASVEEYIQETGRAARGAAIGVGPDVGTCLLLRMPRDCGIHRMFIDSAAPDIDLVRAVWSELSAAERWYGPVARMAPERDDPDERIGLAAAYLVRAGALTRLDDLAWRGRVWIPGDADALIAQFNGIEPRLAAGFPEVVRAADQLGSEDYEAERWAVELDRPPDEVEDLLLELARRGVLAFHSWETAWHLRRTGVEPKWTVLAEALSQRRQGVQRLSRSAREYRSQDVECRRAWLLRYLGEGHSGGCVGCDVCAPDLPRPWEGVDLTLDEINASIPSTIVVLALVGELEGHQYSRRTLELVLGGRGLKHNRHLVDHPLYGALGSMGRDGIPQVIDVLLTRGLIEERAASGEGRDYVSLCLTDEGRRML